MIDLPSYARFRDRDWPAPEGGTVRLALVGLGEFTTGWVAPSAAAAEHVAVGAVVSGSPAKAARVAEEYDARALGYDGFTRGDAVDAYDAVYIATPNATHPEYARAAAEQGKAVLCEKPLAATLDGARAIVTACRDADVPLQVAYRLHADPVVRWARAAVEAGAIGDPVHAHGTMSQQLFEMISPDPEQWRLNRDLSGGAALIDLGIYPLNTLRFLTGGRPVAGTATARSPDDRFDSVDQHVAFELEYDNGLLAACTASQYSHRGDHLRVSGTAGELVLRPAFFGEVGVELIAGGRRRRFEFPDVNEMREQLAYFASHVLRGARPGPDGEHGLVDMAAIDALYRAAETGERTAVDPPTLD